jgi:sensor c-di-GMP phosphodiesterase-like protein
MEHHKLIETQFSNAIEKCEFEAFYQPKVDIASGRIIGAEALCRWIKNGMIVPPIEFIPILE